MGDQAVSQACDVHQHCMLLNVSDSQSVFTVTPVHTELGLAPRLVLQIH
jgi:hypothetical protein